jgi:tetratricopeptide (TPR) repeat protein
MSEPKFPTTGRPDEAAAGELAPDTRIGGFRLIARLAAGGMGTVWEAEQAAPRRRVALKVLRFAEASADGARRFRFESEILARLRHPHIAQVIASGVHPLPGGESLPWHALEFVAEARTLTGFARERGLDLRARLTLFLDLCDAVQHGHERGVIHRDLKPSNVLVDGAGVLKVIDFGVARARRVDAQEESFRTEVGSVIGTLQYMAPEQIGGGDGVDTRCDVYALGVLLYQLVTGALPCDLDGLGLVEAARAVAERAPRRPSVLARGVSADLDAIVLKALEKDRERRYVSAAALALDLRRHLAGDSVLARPPSASYQVRSFARRHRAASAAALSILLVSVLAAAVSLSQAWRARRAESLATRRYEDVRAIARALLFDVHDAVANLPGATDTRRRLTETAVLYLDTLEREGTEDPALLEELAEGRLRLGLVLGAPSNASQGERALGARELERAIATCERWHELRPGPQARHARARALLALANSERASGRLQRALELCRESEDEARLAAEQDPGAASLVSAARTQTGKVLALLGRSAEAEELLRGSVVDARWLREQGAADELPPRDDLVSALDLGRLLLAQARREEARAALDQALALAERRRARMADDLEASADLALVLAWHGRALCESEQARAGIEQIERAVALRRELLACDPHNATAVQDLAEACAGLGAALLAAHEPERALELYTEALELARERLARAPDGFEERLAYADAEQALHESLRVLGRTQEAGESLARCLETLTAAEAEQPDSLQLERKLGHAWMRTADVARGEGRMQAAIEGYEEAGRRFERAAARDPRHAWTRRMVMVQHCWRGVAHKAAAERAQGAERAEHYEFALQAFEAALDERTRLEPAGYLEARDAAAVEAVLADLQACRTALAGANGP